MPAIVTRVSTTVYAISPEKGPQPAAPINSLTYQPTFGKVSQANANNAYGPRVIQLALRLMF